MKIRSGFWLIPLTNDANFINSISFMTHRSNRVSFVDDEEGKIKANGIKVDNAMTALNGALKGSLDYAIIPGFCCKP